jgi:hypothetical protein
MKHSSIIRVSGDTSETPYSVSVITISKNNIVEFKKIILGKNMSLNNPRKIKRAQEFYSVVRCQKVHQ